MAKQKNKNVENEYTIKFEISVFSSFNLYFFYNIKDFKNFILKQIKLWESEFSITGMGIWSNVYNQFKALLVQIENLNSKTNDNSPELEKTTEQIRLTTFKNPLFLYNKKAIDFINKTELHNRLWGTIIINQIINQDNTNIYSQNYKLLIAYQYVLSLLNVTDHSIDEAKQLNEKTQKLHETVITNITSWQEEHSENQRSNSKHFTDFINASNRTLEEFISEHNKTFTQIQKTFTEKVRIDEPSKLWTSKMEVYSNRGKIWTTLSFVDAMIIAGICFCFFKYFPITTANTETGVLNLTNTIKWVVLTGIGLGTFVYLLRLFVKLALSSFHMSRDAEEKSALTSFYLSLIYSKGIEPEKEKELKNIIMNALFARVDTGLLKGDTSPTIPTAGLSEIVRLVSGKN